MIKLVGLVLISFAVGVFVSIAGIVVLYKLALK